MWDQVKKPEDRFSHNEALILSPVSISNIQDLRLRKLFSVSDVGFSRDNVYRVYAVNSFHLANTDSREMK